MGPGQVNPTTVIPSLDLIAVRSGETPAPGSDEPPVRDDDVFTKYHNYQARILFEPLAEAAEGQAGSAPPCPMQTRLPSGASTRATPNGIP